MPDGGVRAQPGDLAPVAVVREGLLGAVPPHAAHAHALVLPKVE